MFKALHLGDDTLFEQPFPPFCFLKIAVSRWVLECGIFPLAVKLVKVAS